MWEPHKPNRVWYLVGAVCFFIGLGICLTPHYYAWFAAQVQDWDRAEATISKARSNCSNDGDDTCELEVSYRYHYRGRDYHDGKGFAGLPSNTQIISAAKELNARKIRPAYVNRDDPSEAYLFTGSGAGTVIGYYLSGVIVMLLGIQFIRKPHL